MEELYNANGWRLTRESAPLPDGRVKEIVRAHVCDTVHILAFTEDEKLLMLREFRPFYGEHVWMLPSGKVDKETDIREAAQRELQEETGYRGEQLTHFMSFRISERFDYKCHVFIARSLVQAPLPQDAYEMIEVHQLPLEEAIQRVLDSKNAHAASMIGLLQYSWQKDKGDIHKFSTVAPHSEH